MFHAHVTLEWNVREHVLLKAWAESQDFKALRFAMPSFSSPGTWNYECQIASDKYSADYLCNTVKRFLKGTKILRVKEEVDLKAGEGYDAKYYEAHFRLSDSQYKLLMGRIDSDCPNFLYPSRNFDTRNCYLTLAERDFDLFQGKYNGTAAFLTNLCLPVFSHVELVKSDTDPSFTHRVSANILEHSNWLLPEHNM